MLKKTVNIIKSSNNIKLENISKEFIPYACYYDNETIATKAGEFLQVIKIVGFTYEILQENFDLRTTLRNAISSNVKDASFSFWIHTVRRKLNLDPGGDFPYYFAGETHEAWCKKNYWHDKYVNELYITIVYRNLDISLKNIKDFITSFSYSYQVKYFRKEFDDFHQKLNQVSDNILNSLKDYGARKLSIEEDSEGPYSEHLQFFGKIINLSEDRMPLPLLDLSKYLAINKIAFGNINFEIRQNNIKRFGAIFSIKEYRELDLDELDNFLQLPQEMVITQSVNFVNSRKLFKKYNYQNYILRLSDDEEFAEMSGLAQMLQDLDHGPTDFGNSQLTIMIKADTVSLLEEYITKSIETLSKLGVLIVREDLNLENCYWSQLPGNFSYLVRNSPINSKLVAGFASLYDFPAGKLTSKWGKALTLFRTSKGTPYFFNFHTQEAGHTIIVGPRASGKNTLLNFLISESCKFDPNIFIFDYHNKCELLINALDQKYYDLNEITINPFSLENNIENKNFITKWLGEILYDKDIKTEISDYIKNLIDKSYDIENNVVSLNNLLDIIQKDKIISNEIKTDFIAKFETILKDEELKNLFLNDNFSFSKITAMETGNIKSEKYHKLIASYIIHKSKSLLTGSPTIFVIQNINILIDIINIEEWLNYLTLNNAIAIILLDQEEMELTNEIIDLIPTQIFLPHEFIKEHFKESYKLTKAEFNLFKKIKYINRHFLLKQAGDTVIAELNLSGINNILSILTGNLDFKAQILEAKSFSGNDPEKWLPDFYQKINV